MAVPAPGSPACSAALRSLHPKFPDSTSTLPTPVAPLPLRRGSSRSAIEVADLEDDHEPGSGPPDLIGGEDDGEGWNAADDEQDEQLDPDEDEDELGDFADGGDAFEEDGDGDVAVNSDDEGGPGPGRAVSSVSTFASCSAQDPSHSRYRVHQFRDRPSRPSLPSSTASRPLPITRPLRRTPSRFSWPRKRSPTSGRLSRTTGRSRTGARSSNRANVARRPSSRRVELLQRQSADSIADRGFLPFQVLTGMPIAVDAFRYGAVPKVMA